MRDRHPRLEPREGPQDPAGVGRTLRRLIERLGKQQVGLGESRELEVLREYAHNPSGLGIERDRLADQARITPEPAPPQTEGNERHFGRARLVFLASEIAAKERLYLEGGKKSGFHPRAT